MYVYLYVYYFNIHLLYFISFLHKIPLSNVSGTNDKYVAVLLMFVFHELNSYNIGFSLCELYGENELDKGENLEEKRDTAKRSRRTCKVKNISETTEVSIQ